MRDSNVVIVSPTLNQPKQLSTSTMVSCNVRPLRDRRIRSVRAIGVMLERVTALA
jgi:hypothetical protein